MSTTQKQVTEQKPVEQKPAHPLYQRYTDAPINSAIRKPRTVLV